MTRRLSQWSVLASVASVLLMLGALVVWVPGPAEAATTLALVIGEDTSTPKVPYKTFDGNPAKMYDIDGDGTLEIIVQNNNNWVYVFDSKTGAILFEVKTTFPPWWFLRSLSGPEVAVVNEDGIVRLIVANSAAVLTSYSFEGVSETDKKFVFHKDWELRLNQCFTDASVDSKPVLADLDKDGRFEILVATEELGLYAVKHDGTLYWKNCLGGGNAEPAVADLNLDGWPDVVHVADSGVVSALNGRTGGWIWAYEILNHFDIGSASIPMGAGIGQLDGKGGPDVVVGARDSHDAEDFRNNHVLLLALDSNGQLLWARQDPTGNPLTYTHPIIVDTDGNGINEVYWGDWNTMGHKPGAWEGTGPANYYRYSAAGELVWKQSLPTYWSNKDLALADVDNDGVQEVLVNGPGPGGDGIWYLDSRTGAKETFVSTAPWNVARGPIVGDLWNSGTMQLVVAVGSAEEVDGPGGVLVFDTGAPYSSAWPHLEYPTLGPAAPEPTGCFDASFQVKASGEWWQELFVHPSTPRTISKADIRLNGGSWLPMDKSSWGAWTSSYQAVTGTKVEFRAHDTANQVSQSLAFTWPAKDTTKASVACGGTPPADEPPTTPPLTATYTVGSGSNQWWVEVSVASSKTITKVDARVDGGAWTALSLQDWGSWTKSFFVAECSDVDFRATAGDGTQHVSPKFVWLDKGQCGDATAFTATFKPKAIGNDWWVEADVTANHRIASVSASVDGGAWTPLSKQSWGSWAKSFFVPDGSQVRFQATDGAGATVTSGPTTWT